MKTGALILTNPKNVLADDFDPQQKLGDISCVQREILTFQRAGVDYIVLVIGKNDDDLAKHISKMGAICLRDENEGAQEMYDRVKQGLAYLQHHCGQILITPADVPFFSVETVQTLMQSGAELANPVFKEKRGHPLLLNSSLVSYFLAFSGAEGLRGAIKQCKANRKDIAVEDTGILLDVEESEPEDEVINGHSIARVHPVLQISLSKGQAFFGPDMFHFLRLVDISGSVRKASEQMGLSYSKAWKMLELAENQIGGKIVQRQQGGINGGQACLTDSGRSLMQRYEAFEKEAMSLVENAFEQHFGNFAVEAAEEA